MMFDFLTLLITNLDSLQVLLNYRRKSTCGWQIWNIILDFLGGTFSIAQLVCDSLAEAKAHELTGNWTGIVGNPAKLGLGIVSIIFDVSVDELDYWSALSHLSFYGSVILSLSSGYFHDPALCFVHHILCIGNACSFPV